MTTKTGTSNVGQRRQTGEHETAFNPVGTAAVTVSFDDTLITTRSQLMAACKAIADQLLSKQ